MSEIREENYESDVKLINIVFKYLTISFNYL